MRNRRFIRPAEETAPPTTKSNVQYDNHSDRERPRRVIKTPERLIETF